MQRKKGGIQSPVRTTASAGVR